MSAKRIDQPQMGYYKVQVVKNGPEVPARIHNETCSCTVNGGDESVLHAWRDTCDRTPPEMLAAEIDGQPAFMDRVWIWGVPISKEDYDHMIADAAWARKYAPDDPAANPRRAIEKKKKPDAEPKIVVDLKKLPPILP